MDEKGRISIGRWKINIIDLGVIVFIIICLTTMVPACFKITGQDRKAIENRITKDLKESLEKKLSDELAEQRNKTLQQDKMADDMVKAQKIWYEGFKEGYAQGYGEGKN